jgi:phage shock protein PspC (stress-responsive transcriptional regulator)
VERKAVNDSRNEYRPRQLYRNSERGLIFGVCAGIAENFQWPVWLTRIGALALGWLFPVSAVVVYVIAALILPKRSLRYCGEGDERSFWQSRSRQS